MAKGIYQVGLLMALGLGVAGSASGQGRGGSAPKRGFSAPVRSFSAPARGSSAPMRSFPARTRPQMGGSTGRSPSGVRPGFVRPRGAGRGIFGPGESTPGSCGGFIEACENAFFPPPIITASPQEPNFGIVNGVPGLGFDFPHLAAINRGFNGQFAFFNALNNGFANNGFGIIPFFGSSPVYYPPYEEGPDYYTSGGQQPQFVIPQPQPASRPPEATPKATEPQTPATPPPELGQLILVRRDGQVLLAVAFTTNHGQLTYITREGTRRSFSLSELDKDATRQMNEANGTSVSLPE